MRRIAVFVTTALLFACGNPEAERAQKQLEHRTALEKTVRADLEKWTKDPLAMQIRNLAEIPQGICGEVNMKDEREHYQGFMHFIDRRDFKGDPGFNPSVANPETVFPLKGIDDVLKLCMTAPQREAYEERYEAAAGAWKQRTQREYEKAQVDLLNQQLRAEELTDRH